MEIHIDAELNVTPKGAERYVMVMFASQSAEDKSPAKRITATFDCPEPDCNEKATVERGTKYEHNCDQPKKRRRLAQVI